MSVSIHSVSCVSPTQPSPLDTENRRLEVAIFSNIFHCLSEGRNYSRITTHGTITFGRISIIVFWWWRLSLRSMSAITAGSRSLPVQLRTVGVVKVDKNRSRRSRPKKYSTVFSNKLIDLAISADAESSQCQSTLSSEAVSQEEQQNNGFTPELKCCNGEVTTLSDSNLLMEAGNFLNASQMWNSSELDNSGSGGHFQEYQEIPKRLNGLNPDRNLLTVYSSPCGEYFPDSKSSSYVESEEDELPEYVRAMMQKDISLQRLLKTGSVTISEVKNSVERAKDECLGDEDFLTDENGEVNGYVTESGRPFLPIGKLEDWETFPFATRLLELAQLSLAVSSSTKTQISIPKLPVKQNGTTFIRKSEITKTTKLMPTTTITTPPVRVTPIPNQLSKSQKKVQLLNGTSEPKRVCPAKKQKSRAKSEILSLPPLPPTRNSESDNEELADFFHVDLDPMKFLEVSLQEGQGPAQVDDSVRRKYQCTFCSKKFCWSTDLKRHILIHTGERPFKCTECEANFTRKFLMQKHMKKAHQCPIPLKDKPINPVPKHVRKAKERSSLNPCTNSYEGEDILDWKVSLQDFLDPEPELMEQVTATPDENDDSFDDGFDMEEMESRSDENELERVNI